jgi:hypothetical protein
VTCEARDKASRLGPELTGRRREVCQSAMVDEGMLLTNTRSDGANHIIHGY